MSTKICNKIKLKTIKCLLQAKITANRNMKRTEIVKTTCNMKTKSMILATLSHYIFDQLLSERH